MGKRKACRRVSCDLPHIQCHKGHQKAEHHDEDDDPEPDVGHGICSDYLGCKKHRERIGDCTRKTESACDNAAQETSERIESHHHAQCGDDGEHGEHFLEQPQERTETVEDQRDQHYQSISVVHEALRYGPYKRTDSSDVIHHLERCGNDEQEDREHYQRQSVAGCEHQYRCKDSPEDVDSVGTLHGNVLQIVDAAVCKGSEASLGHQICQHDGEHQQAKEQSRDLDECLPGNVDECLLLFSSIHDKLYHSKLTEA